jgi:hypothetical protein
VEENFFDESLPTFAAEATGLLKLFRFKPQLKTIIAGAKHDAMHQANLFCPCASFPECLPVGLPQINRSTQTAWLQRVVVPLRHGPVFWLICMFPMRRRSTSGV